jgi:hypothetical protein
VKLEPWRETLLMLIAFAVFTLVYGYFTLGVL